MITKKKRMYLSAFFMCFSVLSFAQVDATTKEFLDEVNYLLKFNQNTNNTNESKLNIYMDNKWADGIVYGKDSTLTRGYTFRYNVYTDQVELRAIINPSNIHYITIGRKRFVYSEYYNKDSLLLDGYFELISNGKCKLLIRREVKFNQSTNKYSSYGVDASTTIKENFFLKMDNKPAIEIIKSKSFLLQTFYDKQEVVDYIKKQLFIILTYKKIKEIIEYYNSI